MIKDMNIRKIKDILLTISFPLIVYVVMYVIVRTQGITYFGVNSDMWRTIIVNTSMTTVVALAIWLQLKNGRFDFSGGATMILTGIIAGNTVIILDQGPVLMLILCLVISVILNLITGLIYAYGRLPIIICTIGVALLYESITYIVFDGKGLNIMSNTELTIFGSMPYIAVILILALLLFAWYNYYTVEGRRSSLLANNQHASVNIGINENKNVLMTFAVAGALLGLASVIFASQNTLRPQSGLSTAGTFFSYIVPAFMGMIIGKVSKDAIGVFIAALGMEILNYGLSALGLGSGGYQQIIMGFFMLGFYGFTARYTFMKEKLKKLITAGI